MRKRVFADIGSHMNVSELAGLPNDALRTIAEYTGSEHAVSMASINSNTRAAL